jgi:ACS family hexuronate transporter-like MFS transporter
VKRITTQRQSDEAPHYRWVVMGVWLTASVAGFMIMSTIGILLPAVSAELRLSPLQQGMLGSSAYWGNLVLAIPIGWWASRFSPKILTTITLVLGTLFLLAQSFSPGFAVLLVGRVAFGVSVITRQPARALLTQQWFPPRQVVLLNSISNAMFGLVVGGGVAASPFILVALGDDWRATLLWFAGLFGVLTILWLIFGRERITAEYRRRLGSQDVNVLKGALRYRDLWIGGLGFVGATAAWSGFLSFYPTLMLDTYQMSLIWSGGILAVGIFVGGLCGLGFGWLVMVSDQGRTILLGTGAVMAITFAGMTLTGSLPTLLALTLVNGIAWGFWPVLYSVPFNLPGIRPREIAVSLAFIQMNSSAGIALGPLAVGILQELTGDLRLSLIVVSFASLSLCGAGLMMKHGLSSRTSALPEPATSATGS